MSEREQPAPADANRIAAKNELVLAFAALLRAMEAEHLAQRAARQEAAA